MQKLSQHRFDSNMVGPEEVDDDLQQEITGEIPSRSHLTTTRSPFLFQTSVRNTGK